MTKSKDDARKKHKVKVMRNGPYLVSREVPLSKRSISVDPDGQCHGWKERKKYPEQESYVLCLCRCGRSSNKPFRDGKHLG